ncbi:MAG: sugar phosphate isomerase/epimerase [Lachnospiraceae bacterium]|nr:sugar phosphate isomerase/epimerase [Lachnospiraceae bacterium]
MLRLGVQTKNIVSDENPEEGFALMKRVGFSCADFSLNAYLSNREIYQGEVNRFFDRSLSELEFFFAPHRRGAEAAGIEINQMHMPYPIYVPGAGPERNEYLWNVVAPKSMELCAFFRCPYIVVHGFKMTHFLGSEEKEWEQTEKFLRFLAPTAKELGITICIENLYDNVGGHLVEGPCCQARKAAERIDRLNERYHAEIFGFCFDTGHANLVGIDFENFMATLGSRLKVLHIHDNDGTSDQHQIPFTFTRTRENRSSTDWEGFARGLERACFDGVLSFETAPVLTAFPEVMRAEVLSFLAKIGNYFSA